MFSIKIISAKYRIRIYKIWRYLITFLPYIIDFWNLQNIFEFVKTAKFFSKATRF